MKLAKSDMVDCITSWLNEWNQHRLEGVMELMHDDVVFENWNGSQVVGKDPLRQSWLPWFLRHGNFRFAVEDIFVDELEQKALFRWHLDWPSLEKAYRGKLESRRGVDVLHFLDGKIYKKYTYSKTFVVIENQSVELIAAKIN